MDIEKGMILEDLYDNHCEYGFVIIKEGLASEQREKMRDLVANAKDLSNNLDDKIKNKFRREFNKQIINFDSALNQGSDIRNMDKQLNKAILVYRKYKGKT